MRAVLILVAALAATPLLAKGEVDTANRGAYTCEMPGDAAGLAGNPQPDKDFRIRSASRYKSEQGDGVYLRQGDTIRFTSGPRAGEAYKIVSSNMVRRLQPDGTPGRLRCIRTGR
ncbi:elongation factor P [Tsuneonella sp. HG222]